MRSVRTIATWTCIRTAGDRRATNASDGEHSHGRRLLMGKHAARSARRAFVALAVAALAGMLSVACGENHLEPPPPDTTPPVVDVLFPTSPDTYDEDGDGLADFRIAYRDSTGVIDVAQLTVHSLRPVDGPVASGDLLTAWTVDQRDDSLLVFHETIENLLPSQTNQLVVAVVDTAGNVTEDTIRIELPYGALHTMIVTDINRFLPAGGVTICPDDGRLYMTVLDHLVVIDPDALEIIAAVQGPGYEQILPLCVPGDPYLYVTDWRVWRLDRVTLSYGSRVDPSYGSYGIVQSRRDPNLIYVGESGTGVVGIIDRAAGARIGQLLPFAPQDEDITALAVLADDEKLYVPRDQETGILVVDPLRDSVLGRIRIGGDEWPDYGVTRSIVLSSDDRWLYAAVMDGDPRGVVKIDTETDSVVRLLPLAVYVPGALALSPDETRMFVTTGDRFENIPSQNVLVDVNGWRVLQQFPRPRAPDEIRWDFAVTFHPNGKLIFVTHNRDLDVYLNRK